MSKYADDVDVSTHPSQETRPLNGADARLRRAGWTIHARPTLGPVLWRHKRSGAIVTQARALAAVKALHQEMRGVK